MTLEIYTLPLLVLFLIWAATWNCRRRHRRHRRFQQLGGLPPGPHPLPIVGNIFNLSWAPHVSLAHLSRKHGPIMTLYLGSLCTVVISSKETARAMLKNCDAQLAGRTIYEAMKGNDGNEGSIITSQYGPHWRMLRRLCTVEFFVKNSIDRTRPVRSRCIDQMVTFLEEHGAGGTRPVDLGWFMFVTVFNHIGNMMLSRDLLGPNSEMGAQFLYHAQQVMELTGKPNVADFFPVLRWLDPQRIRRNTQYHVDKAYEIAMVFINERLTEIETRGGRDVEKQDYLDMLLNFQGQGVNEPSKLPTTMVKVIIFEMFIAGTDTMTSTLEWAMAELLLKPEKLHKVQAELQKVIGSCNKLEETDFQNLPYLNAVVKETLRLHPPIPLLVPHKAMEPCQMVGYHIPKDTQILVNVWAIGRDPDLWPNPLSFEPERFLELEYSVDYKGHNFEFIPFGSGRRMCPATPLVSQLLPLALGSLLHEFDWGLPDEAGALEIDMSERMGITLKKAVPLKVVPIRRRNVKPK